MSSARTKPVDRPTNTTLDQKQKTKELVVHLQQYKAKIPPPKASLQEFQESGEGNKKQSLTRSLVRTPNEREKSVDFWMKNI